MSLYEDQFSERHDFPRVEAPSRILVIASTGRSGSHMLGHALYSTRSFGFPLEYANPANVAEWRRRLGIGPLPDLMAEIQRRRTSPNGVFGIKVHYPHLALFGGFEAFTKCFPNASYVLLSRHDVLKQAVSLSIASQTGVWIHGQKPVNESPQYSFSHIDACLRETILNNASWRYSLAAAGCRYLEVDFDNVRQDLGQATSRIADFLGIPLAENVTAQPLTKLQASSLNNEWAARFVSEFNKSSELLASPGSSHRMLKKILDVLRKES